MAACTALTSGRAEVGRSRMVTFVSEARYRRGPLRLRAGWRQQHDGQVGPWRLPRQRRENGVDVGREERSVGQHEHARFSADFLSQITGAVTDAASEPCTLQQVAGHRTVAATRRKNEDASIAHDR